MTDEEDLIVQVKGWAAVILACGLTTGFVMWALAGFPNVTIPPELWEVVDTILGKEQQ